MAQIQIMNPMRPWEWSKYSEWEAEIKTQNIGQDITRTYHGHSEGQSRDQEGEQHCLQQHGHLTHGTGYISFWTVHYSIYLVTASVHQDTVKEATFEKRNHVQNCNLYDVVFVLFKRVWDENRFFRENIKKVRSCNVKIPIRSPKDWEWYLILPSGFKIFWNT